MGILIDTNIALYLFNGESRIAKLLEGQLVYVSFITELELLGYRHITPDEEQLIRDFLSECVIIDITKDIKESSIKFRKTYGLKLPDAIIAGTAHYLGIPLFSADKDFLVIKEINFVAYEQD